MCELLAKNLELQQRQIQLHDERLRSHQEQFLQQQKQHHEQLLQQQKQFETLFAKHTTTERKQNLFSAEGIANCLTEFQYDPQNGSTFPNYYRRFETIFTKRCHDWSDEEKVTLLMQKLSTEANTKYSNLILPKKPEDIKFEETIQTLSKIFAERDSLFHTRYKCLNLTKAEDQDFLEFAGIVNSLSEQFKVDEITKDQFKSLIFVLGLTAPKDKDIRSRILTIMEQDPNITLQRVTEECQRLINVKRDNSSIEEKNNIARVQYVRKKNKPWSKPTKTWSKPARCETCGNIHKDVCIYKKRFCESCGIKGHKITVCKKIKHEVNAVLSRTENRKYVDVLLNEKKVTFLLDSGSDITIIDQQVWRQIGSPKIRETKKIARGVMKHKVRFIGEFDARISFVGKTITSKIYVIPGENSCLFGTNLFAKFDLFEKPMNSFCNRVHGVEDKTAIKAEKFIHKLKEEFPRVFSEGLGLCTKTEVKFELKEGATPIFKPKRNVPFSSLEKINDELQRLEQLGVISRIDHSQWASPTVYVKKKQNKIRVCADFSTGLNDALKDYTYPLPSPEDIFAKLNGGKIFSKIDLSDAYLQLKVTDSCAKVLTINTHKGLFKLNRLPFGLKVAPAIFQQIMDTMLAGLEFAIAYLDDILIKSANQDEHKNHIRAVFQRINEYGFKASPEKCEFFMQEIQYLGQIINKEGRKPDPRRTDAIKNMPAPDNVAKLQSFLGLAQYYGIYIPKMYELRAPLNELLKKNVKWVWTEDCEKAFKKIKNYLLSDLALAHYDPERPLILATDASNYGIGAVILHRYEDGSTKPIAHASRTLLPAEKHYSQIEKEALSIIFGIKKYHRFLHGRPFILQTDHKPLVTIFGSKKGIPTHTANRLQRWGVTLLNYQFKMEYISSSKLGHADGLSRLIPINRESLEETVIAALKDETEINEVLCNTIRELPVTLEKIKKAAETDDFIKKTKDQIRMNQRNRKEKKISAFSMCDNTLMYADRVVMPKSLQKDILREFHTGHPGMSRMKSLMRCYTYWPQMDKDIENFVKKCRGCQLAAKAPPVMTKPWPETDVPWTRLHIDYAGPIKGFYYLIIVDSFTKWPEIFKFKHPTTKNTISALDEIFSRFGIPKTLVSDNGTMFTAEEFKTYCSSLNIEHITTPVYHPRSNGQVERMVDTFKRSLKKNQGMDTDEKAIQTFLAVYRVTPNPNNRTKASPAELMFARKIRSIFDKLLPCPRKKPDKKYDNIKRYSTGQKIYFRNYRNGKSFWDDGTILKRIGRVVYTIKGPKFECKRHINQIRPRHTESIETTTEEIPMEVFYDTFDISPPIRVPERMDTSTVPSQQGIIRSESPRRGKRKRRPTTRLSPDPKKHRY